MTDPSATSAYHVESLARGLSVLSAFSLERPTLSLTEISQSLQLNKTTTFRLLSTLENLGYLERDEQTKLYRPSLEVLRLGFVVLNGLEVRQVAAPHLRRLVDEVEEAVNLVVLDNHEVVYIDRVGSKHMVSIYRPVGSRLPVYCTSTGKALIAFLPPEQLESVLASITWVRHTERTLITPEAFKENLALVRGRGFADSYGELLPELGAVAAPIRQHSGEVVAAVNISAPTHRISYEKLIDEFGPKVLASARQISLGLGYSPETSKY